jgi:hypothetical protein
MHTYWSEPHLVFSTSNKWKSQWRRKNMFMPKHRKLISCSYVDNMKCWNNPEKDEFQPKGNDDMTRCVTCNKSSLFAPRLKTLENKETTNIIVKQEKFLSVVEMKDINSFLYNIKIHSMYLDSIWLNINYSDSTIGLKLNWIEFKFN